MKVKRVIAMLLVLVMAFSMTYAAAGFTAMASQRLVRTDQARRFCLGTDEKGGSGVEGERNWIKIIQNSNRLHLFSDIEQGVDVAALQVTFEITEWSGVQFPITWGANINFIGDAGSTWCGPDAFKGFSEYLINREGEYTVTCDLAQLCRSKEKSGIAWLQTCEMVIGGLTEGDPTMIEIKDAYIYFPGEEVPADNAPVPAELGVDSIVINPANVSRINGGVFQGWGTSLCWYGNRIGGSEKATQEAAELLYNAETGLGLNIIRFNVGGGDDPTHTHIQRSDSNMPGYWTNYNAQTGEFEYDFTQDANQRNVLLASIGQCPDMLVEMFSNSAPYFMTRSGCTSGTTDEISSNITTQQMPAFAEYMATVVRHYVDEGINVVSVEPMNEPSNGWNVAHYGVKQEGCSIEKGEEQSAMITAMQTAMENHGIADIPLAGCDETNDTTTNQAIAKLGDEALGMLDQINTHTYSRNEKSSQKLYGTAVTLGRNLWMSESDNGGIKGTEAGEMGAALNFASLITDDLNNLQPAAWIMWQAIGSYCDENNEFDPDTLDQKTLDTEGFWGVCYADMNTETIVTTKKYYAFGQYTRFIRPGDSIISVDDACTTAAYSAENGTVTIVIYNTDSKTREVSFDLSAFDKLGSEVSVVRTSGSFADGENWAQLESLQVDSGRVRASIAGNSVTTFVVSGVSHDIAAELEKPFADESGEDTPAAPVELADSRPIPSVESLTGRICFANGDWSYTVMTDDATALTGIPVSTMENGSYSLVLPGIVTEDGSSLESVGAVVFCIDLVDYAKHITGIDSSVIKSDDELAEYNKLLAQTVRVTVTSITQDGEELELDSARVVVGDTEQNGNLRIEFYNMYGPTAESYAVDPEYICFSKDLTINFDIELAPLSESDYSTIAPPAEEPEAPEETEASETEMDTEGETSGTRTAVILGVVAGVLVIAAAVVVIVLLAGRKKNKNQ